MFCGQKTDEGGKCFDFVGSDDENRFEQQVHDGPAKNIRTKINEINKQITRAAFTK